MDNIQLPEQPEQAPKLTLDDISTDLFYAEMDTPAKGVEEFNVSTEKAELQDFGNEPELPPSIAFGDIIEPETEKSISGMDDTEAVQHTRILMDIRESVQAHGISYLADGNFRESRKYMYDRNEKENLIRAWSRIIQKHKIRVSPIWDVVQAEVFATGPLLSLAYDNRQIRLELEEERERRRQAEKRNQQYEEKLQHSVSVPYGREDIKTLWKIDENGYFEFDKKRVRIKVTERKEKPLPKGEVYELLCKHNGKEYVDSVFKL